MFLLSEYVNSEYVFRIFQDARDSQKFSKLPKTHDSWISQAIRLLVRPNGLIILQAATWTVRLSVLSAARDVHKDNSSKARLTVS